MVWERTIRQRVNLLLYGLPTRARQPVERIGAFLERHSVTLGVAAMLLMTVVVVGAVWSQDLWLNLLAEAIGIGWTVFIIDQLLKWREERRWRPSKHRLYLQLLQKMYDLLKQVLPEAMWESSGLTHYSYGKRTAYITELPRQDRLVPLTTDEINHAVVALVKAKQEVDEIIMQWSFLIDPRLMDLLSGFGEQVSALEHRSYQLMLEREGNPILGAASIYKFLLEQADSRLTLEEYIQSLKQYLHDINTRYGL